MRVRQWNQVSSYKQCFLLLFLLQFTFIIMYTTDNFSPLLSVLNCTFFSMLHRKSLFSLVFSFNSALLTMTLWLLTIIIFQRKKYLLVCSLVIL